MSEVFSLALFLAQFVFILWPMFVIMVLFYSFQGRGGWRGLLRRARRTLLYTWLMLLAAWGFTFLGPPTLPTLIPEPLNSQAFFGGLFLVGFAEVLDSGALRRAARAAWRSAGPGAGASALARSQTRIEMRQVHMLEQLKVMDPYHFEELVAELYRSDGHTARRMGGSGDQGVDIDVRTNTGQRWIVQCKRYRNTVSGSSLRELYGVLNHERAHRAVLVTTADVTNQAEAWARGKPIELIDGPALLAWIERVKQRSRPSLVDRLTEAARALFQPASAPSGLQGQTGQGAPAIQESGPARQVSNTVPVKSAPARVRRGDKIDAQASAAAPQPARALRRPVPSQEARSLESKPLNKPADLIRERVHANGHAAQEMGSAPMPAVSGRFCPRCGGVMRPLPTRPTDIPGRRLLRCQNYPACRVTLEG